MGNVGGRRQHSRHSRDVQNNVQRITELLVQREQLEQRREALRSFLSHRDGQNLSDLSVDQDEGASPLHRSSSLSQRLSRNLSGDLAPEERILSRFIRHHLLLEYLENHNADPLRAEADPATQSDSNNNNSEGDDSDSDGSKTLEGVAELFVEPKPNLEELEAQLVAKAEKMQTFKASVTEMLVSQKTNLERRISVAKDVHTTLRDLLHDHDEASDPERVTIIQSLMTDIENSDDYVDLTAICQLDKELEVIRDNLNILRDLTEVNDEDEVTCTVCLNCPLGIIWDCIKCDHLVCDECRIRITACPTCRTRFKTKAPRRNRWAERLAKVQRMQRL